MINKLSRWFCGLIVALGSMPIAAENLHLPVTDFSNVGLEMFKEKSFKGSTDYQLVQQNTLVVKARANNSASALFREMDIDLNKTPYLNWRWRVDKVLPIVNQQLKRGDDYPARVYVVVKMGIFPWQTKALNYVWANYREATDFWPNPFTEKAMMITVRAGDEGLGQWQQQRVNVVEDFYRVFGQRIDRAHGVAIMTDADNAGGTAVAFYGDIYFSD